MRFKKKFGDFGESKAAYYLLSKGYRIITKNYRYRRYGEIDLIAENREFIVFCEVKTRIERDTDYGLASESITSKKIKRLKRTAERYLLQFPTGKQVRFDVISIYRHLEGEKMVIEHIANAF